MSKPEAWAITAAMLPAILSEAGEESSYEQEMDEAPVEDIAEGEGPGVAGEGEVE